MSKPAGVSVDDAEAADHGVRIYTTDWAEEEELTPSYSVLLAVSEVTGTAPEALNPLYDVIDPDALDEVFHRRDGRDSWAPNGRLNFPYEGCDVTVHADGRTVVSLLDTDES